MVTAWKRGRTALGLGDGVEWRPSERFGGSKPTDGADASAVRNG